MLQRQHPALCALLLLLASCAAATQDKGLRTVIIKIEQRGHTVQNRGAPLLHEPSPPGGDDAAIRPAKPFAWVVEAKEGGQSFEVAVQPSERVKADDLLLTVWDWENRPVSQTKLDAAKPQALAFDVQGRGVFLLTLDGFREKKHVYRLIRSFAVLPANDEARKRWSHSDYWLGICAFPGRYHWSSGGQPTKPAEVAEQQARDIEAGLAARLGLTAARLDVSMVLPEKETAPINWKRMDAAVEAYTSRGFGLALQLMHPPDWAMEEKYKNESKDRWRFPRREDAYRRYVNEIVNRYGRHAMFVQVYNEPDQVEFWGGPPVDYVKEFGWAREEVRKLLPKTPIANGGYAFIDLQRTKHYVENLKGQVDLLAYHSHGNLRELKRDFAVMRGLHKHAGYDKPRYINTECGYAAWRLDQERTQAASVVQKILYSWANGDEGMLLFASRMTKGPAPAPGSRSGRDFGFLDYHFCPRFVYGTVAAFVDVYAGATFERVLIESDNVHAYLFKRGGQRLVAVCALGETKAVTIASDATKAGVVDAMGNRSEWESPQTVRMTARVYPQTIVLDGASRVKVVE